MTHERFFVVDKQVYLFGRVLPRAHWNFPRRGEPSSRLLIPKRVALRPLLWHDCFAGLTFLMANTAESDRVRRSIRTETTARRVFRARISAASAWASIPDTSRSMPAAHPERACGAFLR